MNENENIGQTSISKTSSVEEISDFWDNHSLEDHWGETHEVEFEVRVQQRRRVTLDPDLYNKIEIQARQRGVLPETLVNIWLTERVQEGL